MRKSALATFILALAISSVSMGADKKTQSKTDYTPEQRSQMAAMHENMATCLKSDKPLSECRDEMWKSCKDTMGKDECPMMGAGKMHRRMMNQSK